MDDPASVGGGLLGPILAFIDARKRGLLNNIQNPGQFAEKTKQGLLDWSKNMSFDSSAMHSVMPEMREYGQNAMTQNTLDMGGLLGMTAYHGSPHLFDKFDMSKIGTGEGARAYGHGLYFAENPAVAKDYAVNLTKYADPRNKPLGNSEIDKNLDFLLSDFFHVHDSASKSAVTDFIKQQGKRVRDDWDGHTTDDLLKRINELERSGHLNLDRKGSLYKVDIPDEHVAKMLDWDKPLSQQPPNVQAFIDAAKKATKSQIDGASEGYGPFGDLGASALSAIMRGDVKTGADLVNHIGNGPGATRVLRQAGIPGIRYKDGGSRGGEGGTSNFVLFDDSIPKIIGRE